MSLAPEKSRTYLIEVEELAQDIITMKEQKLNCSYNLNKLREALRALEQTEDRQTWMQLGTVYVKRSTELSKKILREESAKYEIEYDELHNSIKDKSSKLRDVEHQPRLEGFALKPISLAEAKVLHKEFRLS